MDHLLAIVCYRMSVSGLARIYVQQVSMTVQKSDHAHDSRALHLLCVPL